MATTILYYEYGPHTTDSRLAHAYGIDSSSHHCLWAPNSWPQVYRLEGANATTTLAQRPARPPAMSKANPSALQFRQFLLISHARQHLAGSYISTICMGSDKWTSI